MMSYEDGSTKGGRSVQCIRLAITAERMRSLCNAAVDMGGKKEEEDDGDDDVA